MSQNTLGNYDDVLYPSAIYSQTHPDRLATMATLFGLAPPPVERCRVLELGCGDGNNLIGMAVTLPSSEFIGVDLAEKPIQKGQAMIQALGLKNVALHQLDILQSLPDAGRFDFIIAHGIYSWVPEAVRARILAICRERLTDHGIAYVSYNAYPGNHMRDMARQMMRYHVGHFPDPQQQIRQARALIKFLAGSKPEADLYRMVLKQELERITRYHDSGFFHDDLSPGNQPFYFHEFMEHAARHGLQYVCEADILDMQEDDFPPHVSAVLNELETGNLLAREQYLDFLKCRAFRQTLLCRQGLPLSRDLKPNRTHNLFIASAAKPTSPVPDITSSAMEEFQSPKGAVIASANPLIKAAILHLGKMWPRPVHFQELLRHVRAQVAPNAALDSANTAGEAEVLGQFLLQAYPLWFVELQVHAPPFTIELSERPVASPLARLQLQTGNVVTTMRHTALLIEDALTQHLLRLLDGTRDWKALFEALSERVTSGAATVHRDGKPITDLPEALQILAAELEQHLHTLVRSGLILA